MGGWVGGCLFFYSPFAQQSHLWFTQHLGCSFSVARFVHPPTNLSHPSLPFIHVFSAHPSTHSFTHSFHLHPPTFLSTGWVSYCAIESFGSIGVSLFWAFVNATIDLEGAKKAYGLIIAGAQVGGWVGGSIGVI